LTELLTYEIWEDTQVFTEDTFYKVSTIPNLYFTWSSNRTHPIPYIRLLVQTNGR